MNISINILAVAVNNVFTSDCVILLKRFVRTKAVSIDSQRLLLAVSQQESNCRFSRGFRWDDVSFTATTVCENKHRWLVLIYCSTTTRGQATRARR